MKAIPIVKDQDLLEALRDPRRPDAAISRLYELYADDMSKLVQRYGGTDADGQDAFQEVVLAFVFQVQQGRYREEAGIRTYIASMMRHKWFNELRRRGRADARAEAFEAERTEVEEDAARILEQKEATAGLQLVLEQTGDSCRKLLTGFYYGQRSMKELAEEQGLGSEQVARNKKHRCLKKLAELLEANPALEQQLKYFLHGA
jgi:RNA polymerase sigma factor (sigma-70 family)